MIDPIGLWWLTAAGVAWVGVLVGGTGPVGALAVLAGAVSAQLVPSRRVRALAGLAVVAAGVGWTGWAEDARVADALGPEDAGPIVLEATLVTDGRARPPPGSGWYAVVDPDSWDGRPWAGPPLLLSVAEGDPLPQGTSIGATGRLRPGPVSSRGRTLAGVVSVGAVAAADPPTGLLGVADAIRDRVRDVVLTAPPPGGPLLAGFLMGDTSAVDPVVVEDLRRAGLSHFVAVSGSNVALFLVGWWVVTLPLAIHPRTRWAVGLVGLVLFATVTRWEPSVIRASAMAGLLLAARRAGIVLSGASVLGLAVVGTLLVAPRLAADLGFALSVAATLGLLVGARRAADPLRRALRATVAAQVAVAPILLGFVGEVPLAAPLANLLAGPLVSLATVVGGLASVVGSPALAAVAARAADGVVAIARLVAPFPMLGWAGLAGVVGGVAAWRYLPRARVAVSIAAVTLAAATMVGSGPGPGPWVVFLDVGQGDAAIVRGSAGETVLVDGGPDPVVLAGALERHGVRRVDLLVVSHRHADHVTGLGAVVGRLPVGRVWHPDHRDLGALGPLLAHVDAAGIPHGTPAVGSVTRLGSVALEVLGPVRRYASPNDESLVLRVMLDGLEVVFVGDIETHAQADLGPLPGDVLKVPHQGGATSDLGWMAASASSVAVVSVGPNDYGHPSDEVVATLRAAGALVCRTDRDGDVRVAPGAEVACGGSATTLP